MQIQNYSRRVDATILSILFAVILSPVGTLAQSMSGGPYKITSSAQASGGGSSAGGNKVIDGTAGQSAPGPASGSSISHVAGFWPTTRSTPLPNPGGTTTVQFSAASYLVPEDLAALAITVTRSGDTSGTTTVDYATVDASAIQRSDFEYAAGRFTFAPGETTKTFLVLINEDMYVEGAETFNLALTSPVGAQLGSPSDATVTFIDDGSEAVSNPIDDVQAFVYMQYHDFLNREPDAAGLQFWTNEIAKCGNDLTCISAARTNVSAAFYLSIEFQQTGYLLYLMQKASYANMPKYAPFMRDLQEVSRGVIVNSPGWQQKIADNQQQFADKWVNRPEFKAIYDGMANTQFVNAMYTNAGIVPAQVDRDALVARLDNASETRSAALLEVANNLAYRQKEMNSAFVLMEYFGYLRRDPNALPDNDMGGYKFWLDKLNQFGGNFQDAEMVKAFIISLEYRQRFGQ
jgi:Calx-beta domain/Domain of unknown function (DUF4214)